MRRIALLLTAAIGTAALLAFFYPGMIVNAADPAATSVEGEDFTPQPPGTTGTSVVTDATLYSNGQALKFSQDVMASHTVTCSVECDVEVLARGGQTGGSPTLSVNGSPPQTIMNNGPPEAYLFNDVDLPAGSPNTISITAGNTGTGHNLFVDVVSFPASGTDTTPPIVTINSGPGDTSDGAATFTFSGTDNVTPSASLTFQCKLLQGLTTISNWATCTSGQTYPGLDNGDYRFRVRATDSSNNVSLIRSRTFTVTNSGGGGSGSEILVGAGDISTGKRNDQETGDLIRDQLERGGAWGVFTTGDNAYPDGTYQNYQVYDAAWGSFKNMTRPTYGNHDYYGSKTAVGSQQYWNEAPDPTPVNVSNDKSYYVYDVGNSNWRAIVLNSASTEGPSGNLAPDCKPGSAQHNFLLNELSRARTNNKNTVLFWHHARFSASTDHPTSEGDDGCSLHFFDAAHDNGADLVVQGHSHVYERYHTRDRSGTKVASGLTSIVCGTGGNSSDGLQGSPNPTPDVKFTNTWGVCKLTLNTNNAEVRYLEAPNSPGAPVDIATVAVRP